MIPEIIKAPAGIGKTQLAAAKIATSTKRPIEVYTPTHALGTEWHNSLKQKNPSLDIVQICGRSHVGAVGQPLCRKDDLAQEVIKAGLSVFPTLCERQQTKNMPPLRCEHYESCPYIAQFRPADVLIFTHSHLTLLRSSLETWVPHTAIIDESFYQQLIEQVSLQANLLLSAHIPESAASILRLIYEDIINGRSIKNALYESAKNGNLREAIQALQKLKSGVHPEQSLQQQKAKIKKIVSLAPLVLLLKTLYRDKYCQAVQYNSTTGVIKIHHKKSITRFSETTQIKNIDASANQIIIEAIFEKFRFTPLYAKRNAHVIQCHSTRCSTTSLIPERNSDPRSAQDAAKRLEDIQHLINVKSGNANKVLIVGPQAVVGNPASGTASKLVIPPHCDSTHFNGFRGVDKWKNFDVVIVIGRNEPPFEAAEDIARALYIGSPEPLLLTGKCTTAERGYYVHGEQFGVEVTVHPDARVQAIVEQLREEETLQAIDRLRMMHNAATKEVILLSNIPLDIDVDELRNWDDIIYGSRIERAMHANNGILPLTPTWLTKNHPTLWNTENAAKSDVKRELVAFKKSQSSNSNTIRKLTLFNYKTPSQRRWSRCLSGKNDLVEVTTLLQRLVCSGVVVKVL